MINIVEMEEGETFVFILPNTTNFIYGYNISRILGKMEILKRGVVDLHIHTIYKIMAEGLSVLITCLHLFYNIKHKYGCNGNQISQM